MGVKVYHNGNWVEFSTGSNASASFLVQDEGNDLVGLATALNFKGSGVTASNTSGNPSTKEIEITGVTTFLALSDTPTSYVGTAGSVVTVNSTEDGLVFLEADSTGLGRDNYVSSASLTSIVGGGITFTLGFTGPDNLSNISTSVAIGFTQLSDTPTNYTGVGNSFVRVKSSEDGLEFVSQVPGTAVGAVGINSQVQYNDNGALNGAAGLFYLKGDESDGNPGANLVLKPSYTDYSSGTDTIKYGGGAIVAQSNNISATIDDPWNFAGINADGGLELMRRRVESPQGGAYIDFKARSVDMDARIQMDYALESGSINPNSDNYSAITFSTGGTGHYNWQNSPSGRLTEKIRIGRNGEIGILAGSQIPNPSTNTNYNNIQPGLPGSNNPIVDSTSSNRTEAQKFGTNGQVLMSGGYGNSVFWGTNGAGNSLWTQNSAGIYRDTDVMIRRSDNSNSASLAVHGSTLSGTAGSYKNVLDLRSIVDNSDCLTFRSVRITEDTTGAGNPDWYSAAWRIQRRVDVTDQVYIQFGAGNNNPSGTDSNEDIIFGNTGGERLRMESSGQLLIGQSSIINGVFGSAPPRFSVSTPTASPAIFATFSSNSFGSRIDLLKSRNETIGSHTVLQPDDSIGEIYFGGSDGNQFHAGALIQSVVESGVGNDDMPADLRFLTNGGATTVTERLRITSAGNVGIGTTNPTASNIKTALDTNTKVLAVGIVTCNELYVDGNQITGSGGSGSGGGNYASYITSLSGNDEIEFTNIPSWATKITLLGENIILPDTDPVDSNGNPLPIGTLLRFGGDNNGYLGSNAYRNLTSFVAKNTAGTNSFGLSEYDNTPYAPYILLYSSSEGSNPVLSQIHFTFEKVKGQNIWVYSGSSANRKGDLSTPPTSNEDIKFLNEFSGSFTASEVITKLKLSSFEGSTSSTNVNFTGGTLTAIYEGEGGGSGGSGGGGSSLVLLPEETIDPTANTTEVEFDNIPSDAQEITVMFNGVSATGQDDFMIQLGTASAYITTNYDSLSQNEGGGDERSATDCFLIRSDGGNRSRTGSMTIKKASSTSYVQTGQFRVNIPNNPDGGNQIYGSLSSVSDTVTRLKVKTSSGQNFDAGTISVSYKTGGSGGSGGSGGGGGGSVSVATSIKTFTTSGSHTYTPTSGTTSIVVHVIGAGGGSGTPKYYAWSGGGGAGGVAVKTYSVTEFGTSAAIQVGAKGTAGTANNTNNPQNGGTGGSSSFNPNGSGVTITAYGGVGSGAVVGQGNYTEGGDGGAAANGDLNYTGEKGYVFVDRTVDDNGTWSNYNGIVPDWRYHSGSNKARYHLYRAKPSAGGYGSYGLGGEATTTTESSFYNNGREGNDGAVIIYEYAGSGGSGGSGSGGITIEDEGTALSNTATTLNFVGDGVVTSGTGSVKTITISGGGGGGATGAIVSTQLSSDLNVTSPTTYVNVMSVTINPQQSGSKILLTTGGGARGDRNTDVESNDYNQVSRCLIQLYRGNTPIGEEASVPATGDDVGEGFYINFVDTNDHQTNSVTYTVKAKMSLGSSAWLVNGKVRKASSLCAQELVSSGGGGGSSSVTPAVEVTQRSSNLTLSDNPTTYQNYQNILSLNITPSTADSSMLVKVSGGGSGALDFFTVRLKRDTTVLKEWTSSQNEQNLDFEYPLKDTFTHGTTQITYTLEGKKNSNQYQDDDVTISKRTNLVIQEIT